MRTWTGVLAASLLAVALPTSEAQAESAYPNFLAGLGVGGSYGEYSGGTLDLELDFGRHGQYFALSLEGGAGTTSQKYGTFDEKVAIGTLALGWRGIFLHGPLRPTTYLGAFWGYERNFSTKEEFLPAGARLLVGASYFFDQRFSLGAEVGGTLGSHIILGAGTYGAPYSELVETFEARLRFTF